MSTKTHHVIHEDELTYTNPPIPYLSWDERAIRRFLQLRGFNMNQTISKILDWRGWCWVQRK